MRQKLILGLSICAAIYSSAADPQRGKWKLFTSSVYHYTVQYPTSWHLNHPEPPAVLDYLYIFNFPPQQAIRGVVLKAEGASIVVASIPAERDGVDGLIAKDSKSATGLQRRTIRGEATRGGCGDIELVASDQEMGPDTYQTATLLYCSVGNRIYIATLLNWKGDKRQAEYQELALGMMRSLRAQ
jgi:hypothetical protein